MAVLEGLARRLDPHIDLLPVAAPFFFQSTPFGRALRNIAEGIFFDSSSPTPAAAEGATGTGLRNQQKIL
jgi:hypothetical protein